MRQCLVFGAVLAAFGSLALGACGGSSSETPPPLQPDPQGFHYASAPISTADDSDAGAAPLANFPEDDEKPQQRTPPRSTWGSPKAH